MSSHRREILGITSASLSVWVCVSTRSLPAQRVYAHLHVCLCQAQALTKPGLRAGVTKPVGTVTLSRIVAVFSEAEGRSAVCLTQQKTCATQTVAGNASGQPAQSPGLGNRAVCARGGGAEEERESGKSSEGSKKKAMSPVAGRATLPLPSRGGAAGRPRFWKGNPPTPRLPGSALP